MCGITAVIGSTLSLDEVRSLALSMSQRQRHRGPDWSGVWIDAGHPERGVAIAHERLSIVDPFAGGQPIVSRDGRYVLSVNGEIYNHKDLRAEFADHDFVTGSDCEVVIPLVSRGGVSALARLDGVFAFVLYDTREGTYLCARDPIGVNPMYHGTTADGAVAVASELKALVHARCVSQGVFPPGHWMGTWGTGPDGPSAGPTRWYAPRWLVDREYVPCSGGDAAVPERMAAAGAGLRTALEAAVRKRMMADVTVGVLLSGGLDSSLVASIAARALRESGAGAGAAWSRGKLPSFSIGLAGSPDLEAARRVADFLGTAHYGFEFTVQEGMDAVRDVIEHIETYDVTTIRASTPMYLLSRRIKALGVKTVLSGEGADEALAGYLYFARAPDGAELHRECVRKLDNLHLYDCLRANKSTMAWGLEARCPFLDKEFLDAAMEGVDPDLKLPRDGRIEKHVLRAAFDDESDPYLPREVLWRQKEQFSDGVGFSWIDTLKEHAEEKITDRQFAQRAQRFPVNTPQTKEALFYRTIFAEIFPGSHAAETVPGGPSIACSTAAAIAWDASFQGRADPSGRAVAGVHNSAYE